MTEITKCHKCGCTDRRLFHHHRSYEPEEIVMVCMSCHKLLHNKLRREGKCNISPYELSKKSIQSENNRLNNLKRIKKYGIIHNKFDFTFDTILIPYTRLREGIRVWENGTTITFYSNFMSSIKFTYIDII